MTKWAVLVNNGYTYEYEGEVVAKSVSEARKIWKRRGDHKSQRPFRVSRVGEAN
jgi:hypothetical protein